MDVVRIEVMRLLADKLYNLLRDKGYFKNEPQFDEQTEKLIVERKRHQFHTGQRILELLNTSVYFLKLYRGDKDINTAGKELEILQYTIYTNDALSNYESLKRLFCIALDLKKMGIKSKTPTYGTIIRALKDINILDPDVLKVLDSVELRNTIAHHDWYILNNKFIYHGKDEKPTPLEDFQRSLTDFIAFNVMFSEIYWVKHFTSEIEHV